MSDLGDLLSRQSGVVSRRQLVGLGLAPHDVRRLLRRRELTVMVRGIYLNHTGDPTWIQQAWAVVLDLWPAALCHRSALRAEEGSDRSERDDVIHVAIERDRSPAPPPGARVHRMSDLDAKVLWNLSPPRVRAEEAVIDLAAAAPDELATIALLADAVQSRRTTARRLQAALSRRTRVHRRSFLESVLGDVAAGTCSVLEHGYLVRVERAHALPTADRQVWDSLRGPAYRDVEYPRQDLVVELCGRMFHDSALSFDADLERDLDVAVDGRLTVRLGWGQVFRRACPTAAKLGAILQSRGWEGAPVPCDSCAGQELPRYAGVT